jgi:NitT/TauT family transport system substrate-binding protein
MKRRSFIGSGSLTTAAILSGCSHKRQNNKLQIGYLPITDATPLLIAHALGFFKDEGLDVPRPVMIRSWAALIESFLAGNVNIVHLLFPIPIWMRYRYKYPVKVVAWNHLNGSAITIAGASSIYTFSDLGGKNIAVPFWYSMHNIILQMAISSAALRPVIKPLGSKLMPYEVNLLIIPPPEMPSALASGKIDGFIVAEPFNAVAEIKTSARILRFSGDIWKNHPCCVAVMREEFIKQEPLTAEKAIRALVRAQAWVKTHKSECAKILSLDGDGYLPVNNNILLRVFTDDVLGQYSDQKSVIKHTDWGFERIGFQPFPYPSATAFIYDHMKDTLVDGDTGFLKDFKTSFVVKDLVEDSFVKTALKDSDYNGVFQDTISSGYTRKEVIRL